MAVFPLLAEPDRYQPMTIDLVDDPVAQRHWLDVFDKHLPSLLEHAIASQPARPDAPRRAEAAGAQFGRMIATLRRRPAAFDQRVGPISILSICRLREQVLRRHGFDDPYAPVKQRENDAAEPLLKPLLAELDGLAERERLEAVIAGIAAGNLFDLGAAGSYDLYHDGGFDFHATRDKVARPWRVDQVDALVEALADRRYERALLLVDNAGADLLLGMVPLARELVKRGTRVILAANSEPSLNDVTFDELMAMWPRIGAQDALLGQAMTQGLLSAVPSGNDVPLIDLANISDALAAASEGVDLLVIEGMGRALESNYHVRFVCDTVKLAMIKERWVAQAFGGRLYDVICRFERAGGR